MADGERRMLFDIRGRRKNVVQVVYAILAVMMGASLFLVVGPVNIGALLNTADEVDRSAEIFDEQIERTEQRLRKDPNNEDILISLTRARINAGRANSEIDPTTGEATVTAKARAEYEKANDAWARYLKVAEGEPNPSLASLVAGTAFLLAQNSKTYAEAIEYLGAAADARSASPRRPGPASAPGRPWPPTRTCPATKPPAPRPAARRRRWPEPRRKRSRSTNSWWPSKNSRRKSRKPRRKPKRPKRAKAKKPSRTRSAASAAVAARRRSLAGPPGRRLVPP